MQKFWKTTLPVMFAFFSCSAWAQTDIELADKSYQLHAYQRAVEGYEKIISSQPGNIHVITRLADAYRILNNNENAAKWYSQALNVKGAQEEVYLNYGKVLMSLGQYEKAIEQFRLYAVSQPAEGNQLIKSCEFAKDNKDRKTEFKTEIAYVSTSSTDFGPALWGNQLVWSSGRPDLKRKTGTSTAWTGESGNQLFRGDIGESGAISNTTFLKNDLKNKFNEGPVTFSGDGKWVAYCKNNFIEGNRQVADAGVKLSIFIAQVNDNGDWVNEKAFPFNGSDFSTGYPFLTQDGNALYFASDKSSGAGGYDLYVSYKRGENWAAPENLGSDVNTSGDEITPFIASDILYFASDLQAGFGGFDIFKSETVAGDWGKVTNMGYGVNSSGDDYGLVYNHRNGLGFMTSNRKGGRGLEDIYVVKKPAKMLTFTILDALDKTPVAGVNIDLSACGDKIQKTDANGKIVIGAMEEMDCEASISKAGYKTVKANVSTAKSAYDIKLVATDDEFLGKVIDLATQKPLAGVSVRLMDQDRKIRYQEAVSDKEGNYTLLLRKNAAYSIEFSKSEYQLAYRVIKTETGADKNILSTTSVKPVYYVEPKKAESAPVPASAPVATSKEPGKEVKSSEIAAKSTQTAPEKAKTTTASVPLKPAAEKPVKEVEKAKPAEVKKEPVVVAKVNEEKPKTTEPVPAKTVAKTEDSAKTVKSEPVKPPATTTKGAAAVVKDAFAVQISVFTIGQPINMSTYEDLNDIGEVYLSPEADKFKLKVGVFKSKELAEAAKAKIIAKGYKGAFIVAEQQNVVTVDKKAEAKPTSYNQPELTEKGIQYKVRIAAYKKPEYFDMKKVADIGKVEQLKVGDVTIFLLGTFDTIQAAEKARQQVADKGFKDAMVVIRNGNELIKAVKLQ